MEPDILTNEGWFRMGSSSFDSIKKLVEGGQVEIVHVLSPPRTVSTIYGKALGGGADVYFHEPFLRVKVKTFEEGCTAVLDQAKILIEQADDRRPVRMVIKDIPDSFSPEEWGQWMDVVGNFSVILSEPHQQTQSLERVSAKRINNTLNPIPMLKSMWQSIRSKAGPQMLWEMAVYQGFRYVEDVFRYATGTKSRSNPPLPKLLESFVVQLNGHAYRSLDLHIQAIEQHIEQNSEKNFLIVTGNGLKMSPEILGIIASMFGLNSITDNYIENTIVDFYPVGGTIDNPWHALAVRSTRINPPDPEKDTPKPTDRFSPYIQEQLLTHVAFYMKLLLHSSTILPDIEKIEALKDVNPVDAYAMAQAQLISQNQCMTSAFAGRCHEILNKIRFNSPAFADALNIIDGVVSSRVGGNAAFTD